MPDHGAPRIQAVQKSPSLAANINAKQNSHACSRCQAREAALAGEIADGCQSGSEVFGRASGRTRPEPAAAATRVCSRCRAGEAAMAGKVAEGCQVVLRCMRGPVQPSSPSSSSPPSTFIPNSLILRVKVLRPQPKSTAASRRRPAVCLRAVSIMIRSKLGTALSSRLD